MSVMSKETYYSVKTDPLQCQKRPTTVSDLAKQCSDERDVKRDLLQCQNRPTTVSDLAKQYSDERDKNRVMPKDRGKIFDFNPESVN
jgi:hypothetical protein